MNEFLRDLDFGNVWTKICATAIVIVVVLGFVKGCEYTTKSEMHRREMNMKSSENFWKYNKNEKAILVQD